MIETYRVLNSEGSAVDRGTYQGMIVELYRREITVCSIHDDSDHFHFPYQGTLRLQDDGKDGLSITLEGDDELELEGLRIIAGLSGKFKIEKI